MPVNMMRAIATIDILERSYENRGDKTENECQAHLRILLGRDQLNSTLGFGRSSL